MREPADPGALAVDAYLARVPARFRPLLREVRRAVREAAPDARELLSYGMPAFRMRRNLVYYAAFQNHCSLFLPSAGVRARFARELQRFAGGKGTIQFTPEHPIPLGLLKRIVRARVREQAERSPPPRRRPRRRRPPRH
ncbi:MAG TPA: DUF1801 domain-containing protein [Thermoplasmata archaeon]|nr:DUF1801 domain-containing protein [Thermoplasmata archaeon]